LSSRNVGVGRIDRAPEPGTKEIVITDDHGELGSAFDSIGLARQ
jgi:hypothetical protein